MKIIEGILKNKSEQDIISEVSNILNDAYYENHNNFTIPELNIFYIDSLDRDVNQNGFDGYFFNSAGDFAHETLDALKAIGSKIYYEILKNAINVFPNSIVPKDRNERQELLFEITKRNDDLEDYLELWEDCDRKYWDYEEDLHSLIIEYIKSNINEFR